METTKKFRRIFIQNYGKKVDLLRPTLLNIIDFDKGLYLLTTTYKHKYVLLQAKKNSIIENEELIEIDTYKYKGVKGKILTKQKLTQENLIDPNFVFNLKSSLGVNKLTFHFIIEI